MVKNRERRPSRNSDDLCVFSRQNDILARIQDILTWTKNEQNLWYNDQNLSILATATLLKAGYNRINLNIPWVEERVKESLKTNRYLNDVDSFCSISAGMLALFLTERKSKRNILSFIRKSIGELERRNWMNSAKTIAFLTILLSEVAGSEEIQKYESIVDKIEERLVANIRDSEIGHEDLSYTLFALSFVSPDTTRRFLSKETKSREALAEHPSIEIRAISLQTFDRSGISCVESLHKTLWDYFEVYEYGAVEKKILSKITTGIYDQISGIKGGTEDFNVKMLDDKAIISLRIPAESLNEMVKRIPPLDKLCIIALSILYSAYRTLYMLTERKQYEYQRLQGLENRETHTPVRNEDLTNISKRFYRYEKIKIVIIHVVLPFFMLIGSIFLGYLLNPYAQRFESPFRELIVFLPSILTSGFSLYEALIAVWDKLSVAKRKAGKFKREGIWEDLPQIS